jgi:hypothetical protein
VPLHTKAVRSDIIKGGEFVVWAFSREQWGRQLTIPTEQGPMKAEAKGIFCNSTQ